MSKNNVYIVILKLLREKGLTQTEFAKKTGISQPALSTIMSGKYEPKVSTIKKIAKGFDMSFDDLLLLIENNKCSVSLDKKQNKNIDDIIDKINLRIALLEEKMKRYETENSLLKKEIEKLQKVK